MGTHGRRLEIELDGKKLVIDLDEVEKKSLGEQAQILSVLREYEEALQWNPMLAYKPASEKHAAFHSAMVPMKALFGGNRAGKTTTGIVDDIIQMTPKELLPERLHAFKKWECPFYCRVMTPDMQRTMIPVIHQKIREWMPKALLRAGSFDKAYDKAAACLRLECGCRFDFLSYEMDLDKFGGAAMHRCHYDEEPPATIRRECLMRLVDFNGDEVLSMTPLKGLGWTYKEVWKNPDPNIFKVQIGLGENPHVSREAMERILASITDPLEREAREFGSFVHFGGLVYPEWRNVLAPPRSPRELKEFDHVVAIDPGIRFAGLTFTAFDEANASFTYAARKLTNATAPTYAAEIRRVLAAWGKTVEDVHFVIDPAGRARSLVNAENVQDELARHGIFANAGQNDVQTGVAQIRRRMENRTCLVADPSLGGDTFALMEELEEYRQEVKEDADDGQFRIIKQHDHVVDAWRYAHMERPWLPEFEPTVGEEKLPWWAVASPPPRPHRGDYGSSVMGSMA